MDTLNWLGYVGGAVGLGTLSIAIVASLLSLRIPAGSLEGHAGAVLTAPWVLGMFALFTALVYILSRPLPCADAAALQPVTWLSLTMASAGLMLITCGCALHPWGLRTLSAHFAPSSATGVRLDAAHRLVTGGPFAWVRHPMYLGVNLVALGAVPLYLTWGSLALVPVALDLFTRARREERVLETQYGDAWRAYARRTPAVLPYLTQNRHSD